MFETVLRAVDTAHAHISGRVKEQLGLVFALYTIHNIPHDMVAINIHLLLHNTKNKFCEKCEFEEAFHLYIKPGDSQY